MWQRRKRNDVDRPPRDPKGGRVTAIEGQVRDPERVSVFLDGEFAFGISRDAAYLEGVRIGTDLDVADVTRLAQLDDANRATTSAINLLARRPRSEREIRDRLRQKGFEASAIDTAIEKLEGWRYLDDAEFARYWVENREANRPRGKRLLEQELRSKGVDLEVIQSTIEAGVGDEEADALALARSKMRSYANLEPPVARRRLASFLTRRGYGYDVTSRVLAQVLNADDGSAEDVDADESADEAGE